MINRLCCLGFPLLFAVQALQAEVMRTEPSAPATSAPETGCGRKESDRRSGELDAIRQPAAEGRGAEKVREGKISSDEEGSQSEQSDQFSQNQLAWEKWNTQVEEEIFRRVNALAQRAFRHRFQTLACRIAYTVTEDGRIIEVRLLEKSLNDQFDRMVLLVLKSLDGNPILQFPKRSRQTMVRKTGRSSITSASLYPFSDDVDTIRSEIRNAHGKRFIK